MERRDGTTGWWWENKGARVARRTEYGDGDERSRGWHYAVFMLITAACPTPCRGYCDILDDIKIVCKLTASVIKREPGWFRGRGHGDGEGGAGGAGGAGRRQSSNSSMLHAMLGILRCRVMLITAACPTPCRGDCDILDDMKCVCKLNGEHKEALRQICVVLRCNEK